MHKMFTVYDSKAEAFLPPFFMRSRGEAIRAWESEVNNEQSNFCRFPSDFTLFEIGMFDDSNGSVTMYESKVSLGVAVEFKKKPVEQLSLAAINKE